MSNYKQEWWYCEMR